MQTDDFTNFFTSLKKKISGDVLFDTITLNLYATDASVYQERPIVVVKPKNREDVCHAIATAYKYKIPTLARGAGTSLTGQAINHAMILDFSVYMDNILAINPTEKWVHLQPGVVRDILNGVLKQHGLQFGPDPATSSRATIGGMVGNNSSGTRSLIYGKTIDHIIEMTLALPTGEVITISPTTKDQYEVICLGDDTKAALYRAFKKIIHENREEIIDRYPKTMRRSSGYMLDEFVYTDEWNLAKLFCGSEGTLATLLDIKINLIDLPKSTSLCVLHFTDRIASIATVPSIIKHNPTAVEILDDDVISLGRNNSGTLPLLKFIEGRPDALLICEFFGDNKEETTKKANDFAQQMAKDNIGYAWPTMIEPATIADVWTLRKNCTGLLAGIPSTRKPIPFIEDAAIPLKDQASYISKINQYCLDRQVRVAMFAHVSVGLIHVRPMLDLKSEADRKLYRDIAEYAFSLVQQYKGSWSSEHGDGRSRSEFIEQFYGTKIYNAFVEIKAHIDPNNLMNPGIIVNPRKMDEQFRFGDFYQETTLETAYHFLETQNIQRATEMCSGIGDCRKLEGGTMCPSYRGTRDEKHTTRGRANTLRLAISGQLGPNALADKSVKAVFDLCLSCKACKSECPSNVDVARLKSEVLFQHFKTNKRPLLDRFICNTRKSSAFFSGPIAPIVNGIKNLSFTRTLMEKYIGIDRRRKLPDFSVVSFTKWFNKRATQKKSTLIPKTIVLFEDTWMLYNTPDVGISAVTALEAFGFTVILANAGCCQRPRISNGFLDLAKRDGAKTINNLINYIDQGLQIVVCEPSCYTALTDDLPDLLGDRALAMQIKNNIRPIESVLLEALENGTAPQEIQNNATDMMVHGHCHQKAMYGTGDLMQLLKKLSPTKAATLIDAGCCGMAGAFGYDKNHYDLSMKIGEDRLFSAIKACPKNTTPTTTGFSCRHQIEDGCGKKAPHWLEVVFPRK